MARNNLLSTHPLLRSAAHRLLTSALVIFGLATAVFFLAHFSAGNPVYLFISPSTSAQSALQLRKEFGLDQPVTAQYVHWMANAFRGNLGMSFLHGRPVLDVIADFLPNTIILASLALLIEIVVGIPLGALAAKRPGSWLDNAISTLSITVYSMPSFWVGLMLLAIFAYGLGWFPSSQMHSFGSEDESFWWRVLDTLRHAILPAIGIASSGVGAVARYFRSSLVRVHQEEYVLVAQSHGVGKARIFFFYEMPNALGPVVTMIGLEAGTLLGGALVTETLFSWPGMGRLAVQAIVSRDYPLVMGCTLVSGVAVLAGNILADACSLAIDPKRRTAI
jgi:peptide/nickel transport system permease protein